MRETDGRKLTAAQQEDRRRLAARLLGKGWTPGRVAEVFGQSRSWVFAVQGAVRKGGEAALVAIPRPEGAKKVSVQRRAELAALMKDRTPVSFGFDQALWTRGIVRDLIGQRWGIDVSLPTVGIVLHDLGFSPQRPIRKAIEQDPDQVARWEREEFPTITERARKEGAQLYFGDEAGVRSDYHSGTSWAPVGHTPVVPTTGNRTSVSMLSAITRKGTISFEVRTGKVNSGVFTEFCTKLMADTGDKKVFLIVDKASYHTSWETRTFVAKTHGKLTLFFLPSYSPELNPDELVWKNVKHDKIGKSSIKNAAELRSRAIGALEYLRDFPEIITGFFRAPRLAYIHG